METVEVVIRIPKEDMETINNPKGKGKMQDNMESYRKMIQIANRVFLAVENGTVLPKGHGGLIDYDAIISEYIKRIHSYMSEEERMNLFGAIVDEAKVVIAADKED